MTAAAADPTVLTMVKPGGLDAADKQLSIDLGKGVDGTPIRAFAMAAAMGVHNGDNQQPTKITAKSARSTRTSSPTCPRAGAVTSSSSSRRGRGSRSRRR